jgi:membrane peptidoglycan carboxypeptidase
MLAGLPQAPSYYSPLSDDISASKKRQEYVLQKMYLAGNISLDQAKEAANEPLTFVGKQVTLNKYPYFAEYVKEELFKMFEKSVIENKGLKVHTTLDPEIQDSAEKIVADQMKKLASRGASNASVVVANPKTNQILAMIGGSDWDKSKVNVATSLRQPGSSFKPFVYATALENNYSAATILADKSVNFGGNPPYRPKNYDLSYHGNVTARNALAMSLNVPAVEMGKMVGIENVIDTAHKMGITSIKEDPATYGLTVSLGSAEVKLADMVNAYSVFADEGKYSEQTAIAKIVNEKGEEITPKRGQKKQVISKETAFIISNILSDNTARTPTFGSNSPLKTDKTTAVKTGTTDNYSDSWTMGYSPNYVVGVWMGNNDHSPMKKVSGVEGAAYVWHEVITNVLKDKPNDQFVKPDTIKEAWITPSTGALAKYQGKPNLLEYFKEGTEPKDKVDLSYLKQF